MDIFKTFFLMLGKAAGDQPDPQADFLATLPGVIQPFVSVLLSIVPVMGVFALLFAVDDPCWNARAWAASKTGPARIASASGGRSSRLPTG